MAFTALAAPSTASAQVETHIRMSATATQVYDGNVFAVPASQGPKADLITRVGPALEGGYLSLPLEILARYEIQAERYLNHADLNESIAHQDATVSLRYLPAPRVRLSAGASYVQTQTPGEFNLDSQLGVARAPAERLGVNSTFTYNWSGVTDLTLEYMFGRDAVVGGVTSATHRSRVGVQRQTGLRNTYRVDYHVRHFDFGEGTASRSHVITGGWRHDITPRTGLEITVGPRVTEGTIRPELSTVLRRQLSRGELSFGYSRTELTAIGERGTIDVHRVAATGRYRAGRRLSLTATPAFTHSAQDDRRVPVYSLDVESLVQASRRMSLMAWARVGRQEGTLSGAREMIPHRSLGLKFVITLPRGEPGGAGRSTS